MELNYRTAAKKYLAKGLALSMALSGCAAHPNHFDRQMIRLRRGEHRMQHWEIEREHYHKHYGVYPNEDPFYDERVDDFREYGTEHQHKINIDWR